MDSWFVLINLFFGSPLLAAEILDRLPQIFQSNPNLITSIQQACLVLKQNRVG